MPGKAQGQTLSVSITTVDSVLCYGQNNGSLTATASGGTPSYSYAWNTSPVQTTATATNLPAGTYTVTVADASANFATATAHVFQPALLTSHLTSTAALLCYDTSGTIILSVNGGTPPWNYTWSNGDSTPTIFVHSTGGLYSVTLTDHNGCTNIDTITITITPELVIQLQSHEVTNWDTCNGAITSVVTGGTPFTGGTYHYLWSTSPPKTIANITGLCPGIYDLTVTDSNGCQKAESVTLGTNGIKENELLNQIKVFPNPVTDNLQIEINSEVRSENADLRIYDVVGNLVFEKSIATNNTTINVSSFANGVYVVKATTEKGVVVKRFVKE
jgi:hypothetical protein